MYFKERKIKTGKIISVALTLCFLLIQASCHKEIKDPAPTTPGIPPPYAIINNHVFKLEVADTKSAREQGLSNRDSLPADSAMLFVFPDQDYRYFWMKDTLIPLDILFLDSSLNIVDVQTMFPEPGVPDSELKIYRSASPVMYAIEFNSGLASEYGISPGISVSIVK